MANSAAAPKSANAWSDAARRAYVTSIKALKPSSKPVNLTSQQARKAVRDYKDLHAKG